MLPVEVSLPLHKLRVGSKSPSIDGYGVPSKESKDQGCTFVFYGYGDPSKEFQRINSPRSKECITNAHNSETGTSHLNNHGYGLPSKEFKGKNGGNLFYGYGDSTKQFTINGLNSESDTRITIMKMKPQARNPQIKVVFLCFMDMETHLKNLKA
ncbi:hypothetical protein QQP08_024292 [Theobroma cacao]|nr:hypothetical protein QQP08_024292 [Theobroma cacao]